ncbi:Acyl-CoA dehydrogenase [Candidatus Desulfarcum epimagneticum]|uniref:Acyl-CoA dehydrogenase n=1 Tax=uncultured Desulfobacteraceae bacterium TaxID=218296 RepID=A0A484HJE4_9BACT|nr:Acyl-CoA dehydrogenase [uncultured Desulfobacteraceae bacterium]
MSFFNFLLHPNAKAVAGEAREFVKNQVDPEYLKAMDRDEIKFPRELYEKFAEHHLLGVRFPEKYGGRGLDWRAAAAVQAEIGCLGPACGCAFVMPDIVGEALVRFGTEAQKEKFLTPMLKGEKVSAEALTEPRGGSDFFGATSKAEDKGDHFLVNGQKRFVVGAEGADFFFVYVRTDFDPQSPPDRRISAVIIERGPGVEVSYLYGLMGTRGGGTGRLIFRDVKVPRENLVGPLNGGALVFNRMMVPERLCSAAPAIGGMRAALEIAARYSDKRVAFGKKIRRFQAVNSMLARGVTLMDASAGIVYQAALAADREDPRLRRIVSEAKRFATDSMWEVSNLSMQMLGGIGYTDIYPVERFVRDARLCQIWTGTNQIMDQLIQHEYYQEVLDETGKYRDTEKDGLNAGDDMEKVFDDEDMWKTF